MTPLAILLVAMPAAFLLGSIPMSLLLGKAKGVDIRTLGSKNIGATNLGRVLGFKWFLAGFVLDALKGLGPVLAAGQFAGIAGDAAPPAGMLWAWLGVVVASVLGHMFSPWVGFKGGKGVATSFGAMLGAFPILTWPVLIAFAAWALTLTLTRYMGVASCIGAVALPISAGTITALSDRSHTEAVPIYVITALLAVLVVAKHHGNLRRTLAGTEPRFTLKRTA